MYAITTFQTKACSKCGQLKHIESFYRDSRRASGLGSQCKACMLAYSKARSNGVPVILVNEKCRACGELKPIAEFNRDRTKPRGTKLSCKGCTRKMGSKRGKSNEGVKFKKCSSCKTILPSGRFGYSRARGLESRCSDCNAAKRANLSAKNLGCEGTITGPEVREKFDRLGNECFYCGLPASENVTNNGKKNGRLDVEHKAPLSKGGKNTIENVVPACSRCNAIKGDKTAEEFLNTKQENLTVPINVTAADHENERGMIKQLVELGLISEDHIHHTDDATSCFDVTDHQSKTYIELRCRRKYTADQLNSYGGVYLNCDKAWAGVKVARNKNYSWRFVVLCKDGLASARLWHDGNYSPSFASAPVNPESNHERGQALNDSCFAYEIKVRKLS